MEVVIEKGLREIVRRLYSFAPRARQIEVERRMRGRWEHRKLRKADLVVVSFGKSGRTWLRVMMSRFYQLRHGLSERSLIGFDNLNKKNPAIPKVHFTHDNYLKDFTGNRDDKRDFYDRRVVLLVRDPRDVAVSQYHQWRYRMRASKKDLNDYPEHAADVSLQDFVLHPGVLPKIVDFMNLWNRERAKVGDLLVVRYEDLRADTGRELRRILEFTGETPTEAEIANAVDFASVDRMRAMETKRVFWLSGSRLVAKDKTNPNSFKVRRAKVGGYREDFAPDRLKALDEWVDGRLTPGFGYRADEATDPAARPVAARA